MKRIALTFATVLLLHAASVQGQDSFCGAVGTEGCDAVASDSSAIVAWATGCTVNRGPVDIVNPSGARVHYGDDTMAIGPLRGMNTVAVSLGDGGTAVLTFAHPITDGEGPDFAVFENSFNDAFLELAFVEVSTDGERYVRFPSVSLTQDTTQVGSIGTLDPTKLYNLAGKYRYGYGTPFDLAELRDSAGIDVDSIVYVRLVDVVGTINPTYATRDSRGHIVNDPYPTQDTIWGSGGFDLTGVAVLNQRKPATSSISATRHSKVMVAPNPASNTVNVVAGSEGNHTVAIYATDGHLLMSRHFAGRSTTLNISGLGNGVYMLRIDGEATKLVVNRR
ncbi:MAG: T9SS type A sorting domain-containing protein [Bacteroidales bacterium]|nr:T9SS type A sorting domain-containing protein [Bacteroidales bacterium]